VRFSSFNFFSGKAWLHGAAVGLAAALIWIAYYDRWTAASWRVPTEFSGDALEILAHVQAATEGEAVPLRPQVISRLGAPFGANWSAYPTSDQPLLWAIGALARGIGIYPAVNLALLGATVSAALAFFGCARWLRVRWEWAAAGALIFAFTFQTFHRGLTHLLLTFSWTVPPALLCCALIAKSRRLRLLGGGGAFCLATALVLGVSNPYTLFMFLQLAAWALLAQWLGPRRVENLRTGIAVVAVAVAAFVLVEAPGLFAPDNGSLPPIVRNYGGTERYALKPLELVLPPAAHRWEPLAFFGNRYVRWSEWRSNESFAPYLGLVGIVGLVWLLAVGLSSLLRRRAVPGPVLPVAWVLAFASLGGLTNIIAFFTGVMVFRSSNRFSIFISAVVVLFLVSRISRWMRKFPSWASLSAAAGVAVLGVAEELPRPRPGDHHANIAARIASDSDFGRRLEAELAPGAMIFQLPVVAFPEVVPPHRLGDYEHFRPYLATRELCFNYGALKGRSRYRWQRDMETLPAAEMVKRLEGYGFAAVYLNRRGFEDRGEKILGELARLGRTRRIEGRRGDQVVILLEPAERPRPPLATAPSFGRGWQNAQPGEPRWAYGPAAMTYFNPYAQPKCATIRLKLSGVGRRQIRMHLNHAQHPPVWIDEQAREVEFQVTLRPGVNRIDLISPESPVRLSEEPRQLRAFGVHAATVEIVDDAKLAPS
jgi:hypothetical protein